MATTVVNNPTRITSIAEAIYAAVSPIVSDDHMVREAQDAFNEAAQARTNGRFGILLTLANVARSGDWTETEIAMAVAQAVKKANNLESQKAIATFAADCKVAMHPKVRDVAAGLRDVVGQAWSEEGSLPKDQARPCRKAFKREYHMFKSAMVRAKDEGMLLHSAPDAVVWANENDPDFNAATVVKRIKAMLAEVQGMASNFPVAHFTSIAEFMGEVSEDALKAARHGLLQAQADVTESHKLAPLPATVVERMSPAPAATVVEEPATPVAVDPVAAYLDEMEAGLAA